MVKQYVILTYRCICKFKYKVNFYGHITNIDKSLPCPSCRANKLQLDSYDIIVEHDRI